MKPKRAEWSEGKTITVSYGVYFDEKGKLHSVSSAINKFISQDRKKIIRELKKLLPDKTNRAWLSIKTVTEGSVDGAYADGVKASIKTISQLSKEKV
jgi:hypothetical protein